jgi:hypothetical protein
LTVVAFIPLIPQGECVTQLSVVVHNNALARLSISAFTGRSREQQGFLESAQPEKLKPSHHFLVVAAEIPGSRWCFFDSCRVGALVFTAG